MSSAADAQAFDDDEATTPILRYFCADGGPVVTITILLGKVQQEQFTVPAIAHGVCPVPVQWLYDYYELSDQERRDKYQGRFENYYLARRM